MSKSIRVHVLATAVEEFPEDGLTVIDALAMYKFSEDELQEFHHWLTSSKEAQAVITEAHAKLANLLTEWGDQRLGEKIGKGQGPKK